MRFAVLFAACTGILGKNFYFTAYADPPRRALEIVAVDLDASKISTYCLLQPAMTAPAEATRHDSCRQDRGNALPAVKDGHVM